MNPPHFGQRAHSTSDLRHSGRFCASTWASQLPPVRSSAFLCDRRAHESCRQVMRCIASTVWHALILALFCHESAVANLCAGLECWVQCVAKEATFHTIVSSVARVTLFVELLFVKQSTSTDFTPVRPCLHMLLWKADVHRCAAFGLSPLLQNMRRPKSTN